ncbi:HD domain-containing protein [Desulfofundulus sp. TPOSR]|uniref:HD domain-containing protein n=1 Tax=Desulfofundulus sp. TPOSR TaxID=2714340 RepID=UPI00140CC024|nr:HD domain-containing protein [Desulfofundulus sp. TPOSR]NHM26701.1 HD domain-containing protein [Desulfofundulus sp. TPOSR]
MQRKQLQALEDWFNQYVKGFYHDDPDVQAGIRLKEEHTKRVREKILRIGSSLNLGPEDLYLAETIALLHDIGRFKQFALYHTFNDRRSENHALLGIRELERTGVLAALAEEERKLITRSIEYHNLCTLPPDLPDRLSLLARLIRDADKLDILEMFTASLDRKNDKPEAQQISGLPDTPGYSPVLVRNLLQEQLCYYDDMKNFNDRKLLMLSWIYDINFPRSLSEIARNGYVEKIVARLPKTEEVQKVYEHLQAYIVRRLAR